MVIPIAMGCLCARMASRREPVAWYSLLQAWRPVLADRKDGWDLKLVRCSALATVMIPISG